MMRYIKVYHSMIFVILTFTSKINTSVVELTTKINTTDTELRTKPNTSPIALTTNANARFAVLYLKMGFTKYTRLFSPTLLRNHLGIAALGSENATRRELLKILQYNVTLKDKELAKEIKRQADQINSTNFLFVNENSILSKKFKLWTRLIAPARKVSFGSKKTDQIITAIGDTYTENKLRRFTKKFKFDEDTLAVGLNILSFHVKWRKPFTEEIQTENKEKWLHMVATNFKFGEVKELNAKALVLPFKYTRFVMLFLIPHANGLLDLERRLQKVDVTKIPPTLPRQALDLRLAPLKHISRAFVNKKRLIKLGKHKSLNNAADFSSVFKDANGVLLDDLSQRTFIEITREGVNYQSFVVSTFQPSNSSSESFNSDEDDEDENLDVIPPTYIARNYYFFIMNDDYILHAGSIVKNYKTQT